jgi:hypothetical protein
MMSMSEHIHYAAEKAWQGVSRLALHPGRIQERLIKAWHDGFVMVGGLPTDLQEKWDDVYRRSTSIAPAGEEGHYAATIRAMSEDDAQRLADDIYTLAHMIDARSKALQPDSGLEER